MRAEYLERFKASGWADSPPWLFISSAELAKAIGVHIQTLSNWRLRGVGPVPAPSAWFRGRPCRYQLGCVRAWAEGQAGRHFDIGEQRAEWLRDHMGFSDWNDKAAVWKRVQMLMRLSKDFRPENLTREGRDTLFSPQL